MYETKEHDKLPVFWWIITFDSDPTIIVDGGSCPAKDKLDAANKILETMKNAEHVPMRIYVFDSPIEKKFFMKPENIVWVDDKDFIKF